PHFLLVWLSVEFYLRRSRRVDAAAALPETLAIGGLLAAYGLAILVLTPEYLGLVRLLAEPYNRFLHDPFLHLLVTGPGAVLALFALLAWVALRPQARHPELWTAVAIATAACLLAGAAQQKGLRYHFYPSFALGSVLLGLTVVDVTRPLGNRVRVVYRRLAAAVLAATVLVVCVQNVAVAAGAGRDSDRDQFDELVQTVQSHAGRNGVFVMSYHLRSAYPLINYSGARSASRFPHLWILASEYADELGSDRPLRYHDEAHMAPVERYLNQAVVEDFQRHRPDLLIVFRHARDLPVNGLRRLDYIRYFARDPLMSRMLGDYQLIRELGDFLVYQRLPPGAVRTGAAPAVTTGTQDVVGVQESGVHLRIADPTTLMAVLTFLATLLVMARRDDERRGSGAPGE
ncbi:MAG TPA: hypothetical protein VLD58_17115, partial [Gemmatimonadales bacterium]|nr:hypothetical protein [Gemmatimonadales bacterium]